MRRKRLIKLVICFATAICFAVPGQAALKLRLQASNYNPDTGTWADTSGNNNHATQSTAANRPSLAYNQTANGSVVVSFDGINDSLNLTTAIPVTSASAGYTAFAYIRRSGDGTVFSGTVGSLQYRIVSGKQQLVKTSTVILGTGNSVLSSTSFSSINAKINDSAGSYRLNGSSDGNPASNTFSPGITAIGRNAHNAGELFRGYIAEIRIYDEQLSAAAIQAVEAELTAAYEIQGELISIPILSNPTVDDNAYLFIGNYGYIGGSNPAEIEDWPGTGARGINPGNGAGTDFRNNGTNDGHVVFLSDAAAASNTISGWQPGKNYRLTFDYNARSGFVNPGISATAGSTSFSDANIPPVGGKFAYYTANLLHTPATSTETLKISGIDNPGDDTLLFDNVRIFRTGPSIADNGFESPVQPNNDWELASGSGNGTLAGSAWTITGGAGISRNLSGFHNAMYASEGLQLALIQTSGSFSQTIAGFIAGEKYELSLLTMKRTNGGIGGTDLEVVLDAGLGSEIVLIDIAEVTYTAFREEKASFTAAKASYTLTIRASLSGDRTTFIDNIWINQLTESVSGTIFYVE